VPGEFSRRLVSEATPTFPSWYSWDFAGSHGSRLDTGRGVDGSREIPYGFFSTDHLISRWNLRAMSPDLLLRAVPARRKTLAIA